MKKLNVLSEKEISFLLSYIVKDYVLIDKLLNKTILSEDDIADIWDMCSVARCYEFDNNGNPTKRGLIIEDLIDKFYEMGENYSSEKQYQQE